MNRASLVLLAALVAATPSCLMTRYVSQAGYGQLDLLGKTRPIDDVLADPRVSERAKALLAEIPHIKGFGAAHGLAVHRNYTTYTALGRPAAVWFVGASQPLAFRARKWCFPIVGCFPGLGWFDEDRALQHKAQLEAAGYDAIARPASAYSTGGWFPDPVLSSMLSGELDGFPEFANVILHESVHATILVPDQPFFNESIASYVADALTDQWVVDRFGKGSPEQLAWLYNQATRTIRTARMFATYAELDALYKSQLPTAQKLTQKAAIIDTLVDDLRLRRRPNNASLVELRLYRAGAAELAAAHRGCGDLRTMVRAAAQIKRRDFGGDLQEDLGQIAKLLVGKCQTLRR